MAVPAGTYLPAAWAKVAAAGEEVAVGVKDFGGTETCLHPRPRRTHSSPSSSRQEPPGTSAGVYCCKNTGSSAGYCDDHTLVKLT